jgi:hypothetical protein
MAFTTAGGAALGATAPDAPGAAGASGVTPPLGASGGFAFLPEGLPPEYLAHGVAVRGLAAAPEHRERLVLRCGREGEEAQVRLPAALRNAAEQLLEIFAAFLGGLPLRLLAERLAAEHLFQVRRGLAALRAVRLVDDDRAAPGLKRPGAGLAALLGHLEQLAWDERELLQRRDDDRHGALERLGELARALVDLLHDPALVLELVDVVLELLVEHHAIGDDDDAVEDAPVAFIV